MSDEPRRVSSDYVIPADGTRYATAAPGPTVDAFLIDPLPWWKECAAVSRFGAEARRKRHIETVAEVDPDELAAFRKWKRRVEKLLEEGWDRRWLYGDDLAFNEPSPKTKVVYDETVEEYHARIAGLEAEKERREAPFRRKEK